MIRINWWLPDRRVEGWAKRVKGSTRYRLPVMEWVSHGNEGYSTGNILDGIIIGLKGDRCSSACGEHNTTYRLVKSPEANGTMYVNYISIKKNDMMSGICFKIVLWE